MLRSLKTQLAGQVTGRQILDAVTKSIREELGLDAYGFAVQARDTLFTYDVYTDDDTTDDQLACAAAIIAKQVARLAKYDA